MTKYPATTAHKFLQLPNYTLGVYNSHDVHNTARLAIVLPQVLRRNGQWEHYIEHVEPLQTAVLAMQSRGMLLDPAALSRYQAQVRSELRATDEQVLAADPTGELRKPTGKRPNSLNSRPRLRKFLFDTLGLKPVKQTPTELDSTDQETLYRLLQGLRKRDEHARPILESLFHRTRLHTILTRYLNLTPDLDGRVRARVKLTGTKTWRLAYADPALQQFPPETRHLFGAPPGKVYLEADYSQLEARELAYLAGDTASIAVFEAGGDVHIANAMDLFGVGEADVTPAHRNFSKTFLYGITYGAHGDTLKLKLFCPCPRCAATSPPVLNITRDEIRRAQARWFARHPAVHRFQAQVAEAVQRDHFYLHPLGFKRYLSQPWGSDLDRELRNLPMQLGGALLMGRAQNRLHHSDMPAPIVLQHHDSFLFEVPEDLVDFWAERVRKVMEAPVPELGGIHFPVSMKVGRNWGGASDHNPHGLRKLGSVSGKPAAAP